MAKEELIRQVKDEIMTGLSDDVREGRIKNPALGGGVLPDVEKLEALTNEALAKALRDIPRKPNRRVTEVREPICEARWTASGPVTDTPLPVIDTRIAVDPDLDRRIRFLLGQKTWAIRILEWTYPYKPGVSRAEREFQVLKIIDESVKVFGPYKSVIP